jgi:hypothetical protein
VSYRLQIQMHRYHRRLHQHRTYSILVLFQLIPSFVCALLVVKQMSSSSSSSSSIANPNASLSSSSSSTTSTSTSTLSLSSTTTLNQSTTSATTTTSSSPTDEAARLKAQIFYDAAARILHLQERERLARSRESPQRTSSNGTRDNAAAHAEFEAAAAILRLQEEHRVNRTLHAAAVSTFPFMRLPAHVRAHVLSLLPASPLHLLRVRLVCRDLCAITHWNVLWHHLALDQWGIVDPQQRPRRGETWQAYYIETHRMLRKSDETFLRAAVERGLVRVVRDNLDRCFREHAVQHLCVAIQHSQPSIVHLLLPITPPALLANAPTGASSAVSPLRLAIRANRLEIVQCLLAAGASLDTPAILPPLHYAAQRGATPAMMQLLLQRSRSHDAVLAHAADGQTPLHHALAFGHVTCAEWLLARKATLEAVDARGRTPLVAAVRAAYRVSSLRFSAAPHCHSWR